MQNNLKVLVADTDITFLSIAKDKLSERGFEVFTSSNSKDTINILKKIGCDSLLINIDKEDERQALLEYIETMEVKPVVLYSNNFFERKNSFDGDKFLMA